ncbi:MAG: hypothetical protein HDQ88_03685 [Clostridia bacterium]|nr:hypothetical protein [Clostridia bacterium]
MNDLGEGLILPIMRKDDLLYCQLPSGKYAICQRFEGIKEQFDEPSEDFQAELAKMGFVNVE